MKSIFTLLLATVFSSAFAYDGGRLTVTVAAPNTQVMIDGRSYNSNGTGLILENVKPGSHTVKVYRSATYNSGRNNRNRNNRSDRNDLLYSSTIYVRSSYHTDIMVNRFGKALVDEQFISERDGYGNGGYDNGGWNDGGYNDGYGRNERAMSDYDFTQLLQKIRGQWFNKVSTARDALGASYFSTSQVRQVMEIFSADRDKLDLAKSAYRNTVDKENFRQLYDLLSYLSQNELDQWIRTSK